MEKKTATKADPKAKAEPEAKAEPITHVRALVEKRHYSSQGKRLSPPAAPVAFNSIQEFDQFLANKKGLGLFLLEVLEAPEGMAKPELDK
jgi:hypothetical protein